MRLAWLPMSETGVPRQPEPAAASGRAAPGSWPLFWLLHCAGWGLFGAVMFAWGLSFWDPFDAALEKVTLTTVGFALTLGFRRLYQRLQRRTESLPASVATAFIVSFAGAGLWYVLHVVLLQAVYAFAYGVPLALRVPPLPFGTFLYYGLVLLTWSLLYHGIGARVMLEQTRHRAVQAEALAQTARLQALQAQLEPHFLFNTLNSISTLILAGENATANRMVIRLSDFLRLTLERPGAQEIPVAEELDCLRRYLEIEQVRFGERLRVHIEASEETLPSLLPALILQPLVENALKHGVLSREEGGSVLIRAARYGEKLRLAVTDSGSGEATAPSQRNGVGLANTRARLAALYGDKASFALQTTTHGATATVEIPFRLPRETAPTNA
jgi:hypothetical protein